MAIPVVRLAEKDPAWVVAEFLRRLLAAHVHRYASDPTNAERIERYERAQGVREQFELYALQLQLGEPGSIEWITDLESILEDDPEGLWGLTNMVPEIDRFNRREAREYVGEDADPGWYARLTLPGYMDSTDWSGPFDTEAEARRGLEEEEGPFERPEEIEMIYQWLRGRRRYFNSLGLTSPRRLVTAMFELASDFNLSNKTARAMILRIHWAYKR